MEKNITDYFKKVLAGKNQQRLSMNSFRGHLAELSQKERKYIKKVGLEKLVGKYPDNFLVCDDYIYLIELEEKEKSLETSPNQGKGDGRGGVATSQDKKSTINLESTKDDPCTVCSDPIEIFAIGECRHPICYRCSTKLRVLCEDKSCPVCRQTLELVVFSEKLLPIDEHNIDEYIPDKKYGIAFENYRLCEQKSALLRHICPKCPNVLFDNFMSLEDHARVKHQLYYCSICVQQCKIFTEERKTYSKSELTKHIEAGDNAGSAIGGHPLCQFCECRYLDNDELLRHLRLHHCSCRICDEINQGQNNYQFYAEKNSLFEHQRGKHFVCEHPDCIELDEIPVFKDKIDVQGHNLLKHSDEKSKQEKKAGQRIDLFHMYQTKRVKPKRILNAVPDAVGGIQITGRIAYRIEREYSFIERDDAHEFSDNIFFDVESCGLEPTDDIRNYFQSGDRVSAYAIPVTNYTVKSKWRARHVEKIDDENCSDYSEEDSYHVPDAGSAPVEESWNEFPSLATNTIGISSPPPLAGWATKLANVQPLSTQLKPIRNNVISPPKKQDYDVGFIHQNLSDKFGFIQRNKHGDGDFYENIYFKIDSFVSGMQNPLMIGDLRTVLHIGEKVCYVLFPKPPTHSCKSKYRAQRVWKFSENVSNHDPVEPSSTFKTVPTRQKIKNMAETPNLIVVNPNPNRFEVLAEKYRKGIMLDTKDNLSQDSNSSSGRQIDLADIIDDFTKDRRAAEEVEKIGLLAMEEIEPIKPLLSRKASQEDDFKVAIVSDASMKSQSSSVAQKLSVKKEESITELVSRPTSTQNHNSSNSVSNDPGHSRLAKALTVVSNSTSYNKSHQHNTVHTLTDVYSSENDTSEDESSSDDDDDYMTDDPEHITFMETLGVCLKNQAMFKIIRRQISIEMMNKGVGDQSKLQFVEFRKDDSSTHIMFCGSLSTRVGGGNISPPFYVKLEGFYPLGSSWFGDLKARGMVVKIAKDLHHITNSCHYITVARNKMEKVSKVTLHYRNSNFHAGSDVSL